MTRRRREFYPSWMLDRRGADRCGCARITPIDVGVAAGPHFVSFLSKEEEDWADGKRSNVISSERMGRRRRHSSCLECTSIDEPLEILMAIIDLRHESPPSKSDLADRNESVFPGISSIAWSTV